MEIMILIIFFGLLFDYTNGFHDAANVVSTVIATRVLAPLTAIIMAGVFNFLGATHTSGVAETIADGIILSKEATQIMILTAVIGAIVWNLITWFFGFPSSSSYALIGGLVGAAWTGKGDQIILWKGLVNKVILPMFISPIIGFLLAFIFMKLLMHFYEKVFQKKGEKLFAHLQVGSAAIVALSHGLNDAQKSMGVITLGMFAAGMIPNTSIPLWVILACALVMGLGTASGGFRIIRTVGFEITKLAPVQGFAAELSASVVILIASFLGMPISSTQMIVGSVGGVGAAKNLKAVHWTLAKKVCIAWFLTLPGAALVSFSLHKLIALF